MRLFGRQKAIPSIAQLCLISHITSGVYAKSYAFGKRACGDNPYCEVINGTEIWTNDCGIERPSLEGFEEIKEDLVEFFKKYFDEYKAHSMNKTLASDEQTISAFTTKRLAPNVSPSAVWCDGMSKCLIPSCEDLGRRLTLKEKQMAWYVFEFFSVLDHTQHAMYQATQDFFNIIHWDVRHFTRTFTYADELQTIAEMKEQHRRMILGIIMSMTLLASAATVSSQLVMNVVGNSRWAALAARAKNMEAITKSYLDPVGAIVNNGYIGIQNLVLTLDPAKDLKGYEKLVEAFEHSMSGLLRKSLNQLHADAVGLMTGGKTRNGLDLVSLFTMGNFQAPDIMMRSNQSSLMTKYYSAAAINNLWQREGAYIVEASTEGKRCFDDQRSHYRNRVCLPERPNHVYWIYAIGLDTKQTITSPPGFWKLGLGEGFNGLKLSDVARSSIWKEEQGDKYFNGSSDAMHILTQPINNFQYPTEEDVEKAEQEVNPEPENPYSPKLRHHGQVPGAFSLPICRSWSGEAISSVNIENSANAPCLCADFKPPGSPWQFPDYDLFVGTDRFMNNSKLYKNKKFGRMCKERHLCQMHGSWGERLHLPKYDDFAVKEAWSSCENAYEHERVGQQIE